MPDAAGGVANPYAPPVVAAPMSAPLDRPQYAPLARRLSRLAAQFVDGIITIGAVLPGVILMVVGRAFDTPAFRVDRMEPQAIVGVVIAGAAVVALTIYQWILLTRDGQTLGKKALGIKIVRYSDGANPGFGRAVALRLWLSGLFGAIPYVGYLYSLIDILLVFGTERRCLHDYIAGTIVVEVT